MRILAAFCLAGKIQGTRADPQSTFGVWRIIALKAQLAAHLLQARELRIVGCGVLGHIIDCGLWWLL